MLHKGYSISKICGNFRIKHDDKVRVLKLFSSVWLHLRQVVRLVNWGQFFRFYMYIPFRYVIKLHFPFNDFRFTRELMRKKAGHSNFQ